MFSSTILLLSAFIASAAAGAQVPLAVEEEVPSWHSWYFPHINSTTPTGKDAITVYRPVMGDELAALRKLQAGDPMDLAGIPVSRMQGDFNAKDTPALYFYTNTLVAEYWCRAKQAKDVETCAVATYSWTPPEDISVARYMNGTEEWTDLVWTNMYKVNVHHVQQENDWIEGPMSTLDEDREIVISKLDAMQHALVNMDMLKYLKFQYIKPKQDFTCKRDKASDAERMLVQGAHLINNGIQALYETGDKTILEIDRLFQPLLAPIFDGRHFKGFCVPEGIMSFIPDRIIESNMAKLRLAF